MLHRRMPFLSLSLIVVLLTLGLAPHANARSLAGGPPEVEPAAAGEPKLEMVGQIGGVTGVVAAQDGYAYINIGTRLAVVSTGDPRRPVQLGQSALFPEAVNDIVVAGHYAYLAHDTGLRVIDVSNPAAPSLAAFLPMAGPLRVLATGLDPSGQLWLYALREQAGLSVVDISDPHQPSEAAFLETSSRAGDLAVVGQYAYVLRSYQNEVQIVDLSNPHRPVLAGAYTQTTSPQRIAASGNYVYVLDDARVLILDVSNPTAPLLRGQYEWPSPHGWVWDMAAEGNFVYVVMDSHLTVLDVSNPEHPQKVGSLASGGRRVASQGSTVYTADASGLQIVDVSQPSRPVAHAFSHVLFGYPRSLVVGRFDDPDCPRCAFVVTAESELQIVDVSAPAAPRLVKSISLAPVDGIALQSNTLYLWRAAPNETGYLYMFDVSEPTTPQALGSYSLPSGISDVAVRGQYAYLAVLDSCGEPRDGCGEATGGLRVLDLSDPAAPVEIGPLFMPGWGARAIALSSPESRPQYVYIASSTELWIVDVTDPAAPVRVGRRAFPEPWQSSEGPSGIALAGEYLYLPSRDRGIGIIRVADPERPRWIRNLPLEGRTFDVAIQGTRAYVAEGVIFEEEPGGGPRVLDVSDPEGPALIASQAAPRQFRAVAVDGDCAYFLGYGPGLTIYRVADGDTEQVRLALPLILQR